MLKPGVALGFQISGPAEMNVQGAFTQCFLIFQKMLGTFKTFTVKLSILSSMKRSHSKLSKRSERYQTFSQEFPPITHHLIC